MDSERVFLRVFISSNGGQPRLFQLQPRVKLSAVSKGIGVAGSLYFREEKLNDFDTPESLGFAPGIEHAVDLVFVPLSAVQQQAPPLPLPVQSLTPYPATPSFRAAISRSLSGAPEAQLSNHVGPSHPESLATQPLSNDVQSLLRLMKEQREQSNGNASLPTPSPLRQRNDAHVATPNAAVVTPSRIYNPQSNRLRGDFVHGGTGGPVSCETAKANVTLVDRPARHPLPLEHSHNDTIVPHTTWKPSDDLVNHFSRVEGIPTGFVDEPASPKLQGTRPRPVPPRSTRAEVMAAAQETPAAQEASVDGVDRNAQASVQRSTSIRSDVVLMPAIPVCNDSLEHPPTHAYNDFHTELKRLEDELNSERDRRRGLEQKVSYLHALLPPHVIELSAEHEHRRLMQELKSQRQASRSTSVAM